MRTLVIASIVLSAVPGFSQKTLTQLFQDLNSPDAQIREAANSVSIETFKAALPSIGSQTHVLCEALTSSQDVARLDASALLNTLAVLYSDKAFVVSACTKQLTRTASDPLDQIRENSVAALAIKADGPPAEAAPVFEAALSDKVDSVKQFGAAGIVRLAAGADTAGIQALNQRLQSEQSPAAKRALLTGMVMVQKPNPTLAVTASRLIADPDPDVQEAAIGAVEVLNTDKTRALNELANYRSSPLLGEVAKQMLNGAITRLQPATR